MNLPGITLSFPLDDAIKIQNENESIAETRYSRTNP